SANIRPSLARGDAGKVHYLYAAAARRVVRHTRAGRSLRQVREMKKKFRSSAAGLLSRLRRAPEARWSLSERRRERLALQRRTCGVGLAFLTVIAVGAQPPAA